MIVIKITLSHENIRINRSYVKVKDCSSYTLDVHEKNKEHSLAMEVLG